MSPKKNWLSWLPSSARASLPSLAPSEQEVQAKPLPLTETLVEQDSFFCIGSYHAKRGIPCQDYATSGQSAQGYPFAVVSDGCSGAQSNTDNGARVVCHAFAKVLATGKVTPEAVAQALYSQNMFPEQDLIATLVAVWDNGDAIPFWIWGDGVIVAEYATETHIVEVSWSDNKPFYPIYWGMQDAREEFAQATMTVRNWIVQHEDGSIQEAIEERIGEEAFNGLYGLLEKDGLVFVSVFSDGVISIPNKPLSSYLQELRYKNYMGAFVTRRMLRFTYEYEPADDFACASLAFIQKEIVEPLKETSLERDSEATNREILGSTT